MPSVRPPILLVDGYNVIGAWQHLSVLMAADDIEAARNQLIELMANYSASEDLHATLVFDAYAQPTPAVTEQITSHLKVHFTDFRQTADTYIERRCADFAREVRHRQQRMIVVTSDRAQQQVTTGYGAEWLSAHLFEKEVDRSLRAMRRQQQHRRSRSQARIGSSIDPDTHRRLQEWRKRLM